MIWYPVFQHDYFIKSIFISCVTGLPVVRCRSVIILVINKSDFVITRTITDRIGLHSVLFTSINNHYDVRSWASADNLHSFSKTYHIHISTLFLLLVLLTLLRFFHTGVRSNFKKMSTYVINSMGVPYDYDSVMHYNSRAFGSGRVTITRKDGSERFGNSRGLSQKDIQQARLLYCGSVQPPTNRPPTQAPPSGKCHAMTTFLVTQLT